MSQGVQSTAAPAPVETEDLAAAVQRILQQSSEPLTIPKIRSLLPARHRSANLEEALRGPVAGNVVHVYPKYRSRHERFWDRPMAVHLADLLQAALQNGPLPPSELRRKLPVYAQAAVEPVLGDQLAQGKLHRHPRSTPRGRDRIGLEPPDPKDYLRDELTALFDRLRLLGFAREQLRRAAWELLHEEEWAPDSSSAGQAAAPAPAS